MLFLQYVPIPKVVFVRNIDDGADLRPSKVGSGILSQESMMEQFVNQVHSRPSSWNLRKRSLFGGTKELPVCKWDGVRCNLNGSIVELNWNKNLVSFYGNLTWDFLPRTIETVQCSHHRDRHTGAIDFTTLPPAMVSFFINNNALSGTVDLMNLPPGFRLLSANSNKFSGGIVLDFLPPAMNFLALSGNKLGGLLKIGILSPSLSKIYLGANEFTGVLDLTEYCMGKYIDPPQIDLRMNLFSGYEPQGTLPRVVMFLPQKDDISNSV